MENITGIIIAFISGVFGPISVMYIKHLLDKRKPKPDMVTEATGKSIAKFSIIYETVNLNVNSIQSNLKNIPVNLFSRSINQLLSNDVIEVADFKDETIATWGLKYFAEDTGTKSTYQFAIKTLDDKFIGTLGIDFTKRKTKLDMESINHLMVHASSLGGVLMNHLKC